jgi:hypothetical protein
MFKDKIILITRRLSFLFWINEFFDPADRNTFYEEV